jgi:hypothetical protein
MIIGYHLWTKYNSDLDDVDYRFYIGMDPIFITIIRQDLQDH